MSEVKLRIYDISKGLASTFSQMLLGKKIEGVWHTGILVYGIEYFFAGQILSLPPAELEREYSMQPVDIITLGTTTVTQKEFIGRISEISHKFTAATYNVIKWNCNHFTNECSKVLLNGTNIPTEYLNQQEGLMDTPMGQTILQWLESAQQSVQNHIHELVVPGLFKPGSGSPNSTSPQGGSSSEQQSVPTEEVSSPSQGRTLGSNTSVDCSDGKSCGGNGCHSNGAERGCNQRLCGSSACENENIGRTSNTNPTSVNMNCGNPSSGNVAAGAEKRNQTDMMSIDARDIEFVDALNEMLNSASDVKTNEKNSSEDAQGKPDDYGMTDSTNIVDGLQVLRKLAANILSKPTNEKYRVVKKSNIALQRLLSVASGNKCLELINFHETSPDNSNALEEPSFVFPSPNPHVLQQLRRRKTILDAAFVDSQCATSKTSEEPTKTPISITASPQMNSSQFTGPPQSTTSGFPSSTALQNPQVVAEVLNYLANRSRSDGGDALLQGTTQNPQRNVPDYTFQLEQLKNMGFNDKEKNTRILNEVNGNINRAVDRLISES